MRQITEIIIHCTATPEGRDVTVETLRKWHKERGFSDIGYHYVIDRYGCIREGRAEEVIGAHCLGHNEHSIGVCYVGGMSRNMTEPKDTRTPEQKAALLTVCGYLLQKYPSATVHGHNEFANKACPCFDVQKWRKEVGL